MMGKLLFDMGQAADRFDRFLTKHRLIFSALLAAVFAMINVAGGFTVTHKMLRSFVKKGDKKHD